jgi:hypothetical protein
MRAQTGDALFAKYLSRNYKLAELPPHHRAMLDFVVKVNKDAESPRPAACDRQRSTSRYIAARPSRRGKSARPHGRAVGRGDT